MGSIDSTVRFWSQNAPRTAPFMASTTWAGMHSTGRFAAYTVADTWYPSWAENGDLWSPFTDGIVHGLSCSSAGPEAATGQAIIKGDDPLDLNITDVSTTPGAPAPYGGRYPSATLSHNGIWYYGTYCLAEAGRGLNWDILGPFVGFRVSLDEGKTWTEGPHTPEDPIFGENGFTDPVKFGAPHFVDFGKNMEHSPDGYAYLVGHGSMTSRANLSWISGDDIFLARVIPSPSTINDRNAWEFFAGRDADGNDIWGADVADARPIASWPQNMGCATITYLPSAKKFLMAVTDGWPTIKEMNSYILESDSITGPWKMVAYLPEFGKQAYFLNFPSKFISEDGRRAWLCYSANFTSAYLHPQIEIDPPGSRYAMCLLEVEFESLQQ